MPQRIRAGCDEGSYGNGKSLSSLPQRIRAGCDRQQTRTNQLQKRFASAHSRGLRHVRPIRRRSSDPFATAHSRGLRPASHLKAGITRFFATAHSRGLRLNRVKRAISTPPFATAHSRGLRRFDNPQKEVDIVLCHSAFARVATQPLRKVNQPAVPLPQRIRAGCDNHDKKAAGNGYSLPQRIRAGCDTEGDTDKAEYLHFATAHSCGLRRAKAKHTKATHGLCHSAFVRVATRVRTSKCGRTCRSLPQRIRAGCDSAALKADLKQSVFATAHSCGLRPHSIQRVRDIYTFATAHSCGLRRAKGRHHKCRTDFATAHSCGLRRNSFLVCLLRSRLCHSAFVRVATAEKQCSALRICCEKVDSFSSVGESGLALTIFPFSFAAKATYVAINDSFGRAIDRFFGANRTGISVSYDFAEHPCL